MSADGQTVTDGQTLPLVEMSGNPPTVSFDATTRSSAFNGNTVIGWTWTANGSVIGTTNKFSATFPPGSYTMTLVVTDIRSVQSIAVQGTITVTAATWTQRHPSASPSARDEFGMAYDVARGQAVLFGGAFAGPFFGDTWVWDGTNWTQKLPAINPPARRDGVMVYDSTRQQVVLFGGESNSGENLNDTWVWDGTNWTQMFPANSPPARLGHAMAYDALHQQVVLFGGIICCGTGSSDTWVWDGTNWTQMFPATQPAGRSDHRMVYDTARQQVILFGGAGHTAFNDTWIWDGGNWTQKFPASSPSNRLANVMVNDPLHQRVIVFGGDGLSPPGALNDTWVWDGTNWTRISPAASPPIRSFSGGAINITDGTLTVFGGGTCPFCGTFYNDTWVYDAPSP